MIPNTYKYLGAGANQVISTKPIVLKRITIGKDVASSVIEISDSIDDGDGNIMIQIEGSTLIGTWDFNVRFLKGCTMDIANQTNITVEYISM